MTTTAPERPVLAPSKKSFPTVEILAGLVILSVVLRPRLVGLFHQAALQNATTIFVAVCVQALPFLALGVTLSGLIAAFVSPAMLAKALPRRAVLAVPVAGIVGAALPGCECGSVPIAGRLVARGADPAPALTFLLSAPAINPVVLVATSVAFPGRPIMVVARFVASLATSVIVGLVWSRIGKDEWVAVARRRDRPRLDSRWATFADTAVHDLCHAGGFLVIGAFTASILQTVVPKSILDAVAGSGPGAILAMAGLAVVLAICSEADAFVASGLTQFSLTARLVFLVVGPAVDVKLVAMQAGTFGRQFVVRFAPLTFVVAVLTGSVVGLVLLGGAR